MKLFHVQDNDCPMYVLAENWTAAIESWRKHVSDGTEDEPAEPQSVHLVADEDEILVDAQREDVTR